MTTKHHHHGFPASEWPFSDADDAAVFTTSEVFHGEHPILVVSRDEEGDWQFLHGAVSQNDQCHIICLGCVFSRDRSVGQVADLQVGWQAVRTSVDGPWERLPPAPDSSR